MATKITKHSKQRIIERTENCNNFTEAKKLAKQAKKSGVTINEFQQYPHFFSYLQNKRNQTNTCSIRIYQDNIYIWRGKGVLVTVHPIPYRYIKEMKEIDKNQEVEDGTNNLSF